MNLTCIRRLSKKDGNLRLYWQTGFQMTVKQYENGYEVEESDDLKATHRTMRRLLPVFVMFEEFLQSEPVITGVIASVLIVPDDMIDGSGRGFSRILQALKDSHRIMHPRTWDEPNEKSHQKTS